MFPLDFPLRLLLRHAKQTDYVLDPFCGRGTTNFAARLLGMETLGVDSNPVAVAVTASKLAATTPKDILLEAESILDSQEAVPVPEGEFWRWAFHQNVLKDLCRLRYGLLLDCATAPRIALRGIILGALHGPRQKTVATYLSNQCPRTYAPKPTYATNYWQRLGLEPEDRDVMEIFRRRAGRYYTTPLPEKGTVRLADSRHHGSLIPVPSQEKFEWIVTSPPYYGMRTYLPDQWLRSWFLGGSEAVDYSTDGQVTHSSREDFASDLKRVWVNVAEASSPTARLVIRFGGIQDRNADPWELLSHSLSDTGWRVVTRCRAGSARKGKRQADSFLRHRSNPLVEYDVWARRD